MVRKEFLESWPLVVASMCFWSGYGEWCFPVFAVMGFCWVISLENPEKLDHFVLFLVSIRPLHCHCLLLYFAFDAAVVVVDLVESQHPPLLVDFPTSMLCSRRPSPSCLCRCSFWRCVLFSTQPRDRPKGRENLSHTQRKGETLPQTALFFHCFISRTIFIGGLFRSNFLSISNHTPWTNFDLNDVRSSHSTIAKMSSWNYFYKKRC